VFEQAVVCHCSSEAVVQKGRCDGHGDDSEPGRVGKHLVGDVVSKNPAGHLPQPSVKRLQASM
jgi:hypothetical protein